MDVTHDFHTLPPSGCAVALGNFDGVHLGHRQVLSAAAHAEGLHAAALLFEEHPARALKKAPPSRLLTGKQKLELFEQIGISSVCLIPFADVRYCTAETFVREILVEQMHARALFCGFNYRCGVNSSCSTEELASICRPYGISLTVLPPYSYEGAPVSSTRIRRALELGDVTSAGRMLGRAFSYEFQVVSGDQRGRLLGFPTINQFFPADFVRPRYGVYASRAFVGGKWYPSVTNFGSRPTFDGETPRSETCILHFSGNLYGEHVPVALLRFLRPEEKFPSFDALKAQMTVDSRAAEQCFLELGEEKL